MYQDGEEKAKVMADALGLGLGWGWNWGWGVWGGINTPSVFLHLFPTKTFIQPPTPREERPGEAVPLALLMEQSRDRGYQKISKKGFAPPPPTHTQTHEHTNILKVFLFLSLPFFFFFNPSLFHSLIFPFIYFNLFTSPSPSISQFLIFHFVIHSWN